MSINPRPIFLLILMACCLASLGCTGLTLGPVRKLKMRSNPFGVHTCIYCGSKYVPTGIRQKWCSDPECQRIKNNIHSKHEKERMKGRVGNPKYLVKQRNYYSENAEKLRKARRISCELNPKRRLLSNAKDRARSLGIPFKIKMIDIEMPKVCPVLGIPFEIGIGKQINGSPSLDRIIPELGYIPGNVIVVSSLANRIKNNATVEQIRLVADFYERIIKK